MNSVILPESWRRKHLSPAEQRVVELTATGLSTKEVAARLNKSTLTARNQLNRAMRKIGVHSRYELIARLHSVREGISARQASLQSRPAATVPDFDSFAYAI